MLPAPAAAEDATIVSRDVPLGAQRSLTAGQPSTRFNLVGLHWRGPGTVQFRTRSLAGRWSGWAAAAPEAEDQPDAGTAERARLSSWRLGNPWWVGPSDRIEYRLRGRVTRLRAYFVWSPPAGVPARTLQKAGSPAIVPRSGWNADEKIRRNTPAYASAIRLAVVHHTAGANGYTAAQSPAIVRAIELYHVKGNGWNDIGYNFLVDRFGTVFEGRFGGIERNVIGAHAEGFNTGSVGVAVVGEYSSLAVSPQVRDSLAKLLAWRLDLAHVDPLSTLSFISGGNARFPAGLPVFLRTVSGHRDTGFTDCPGTALYNLLNGDRRGRGEDRPAEAVRARGHRSSARPRPVQGAPLLAAAVDRRCVRRRRERVRLELGGRTERRLELGCHAGRAGEVHVPDPFGRQRHTRGRDDRRGRRSCLRRRRARRRSCNGLAQRGHRRRRDGDHLHAHRGGERGRDVARRPRRARWRRSSAKSWRRAGQHTVRFDPLEVPDGLFRVDLLAVASGGRQATASTQLAISRTLGSTAATRLAFSPNGDGFADRIGFSFELAAQAEIRVRILKQGKWVATPFKGPLELGPHKVEWDGAKRIGRLLDGEYEAVVEATDAFATTTVTMPFSADTRAPKVKILQRSPLKLWLSEPATVTHALRHAAACLQRSRGRRGAHPECAEAGDRPGGRLGRCRQQKHACLPALTVNSAGATACAQIPSNQSGPSARPPTGLREIERSNSGEESEGRRCAGARRALRAARTPGGAPGASRAP